MEFSVPLRDECTALTLVSHRRGNAKAITNDARPPGDSSRFSYSILAAFTDGSIRLLDPSHAVPPRTLGHIHGKGVHRALRMDLAVSEDGRWCFASALRGSMELMAIRLASKEEESSLENDDDTFRTYSHCDAKLRGLGACTKVTDNKYLLLTGKSIKNIHIWSFVPPSHCNSNHPTWQCLYDCPTNGNTIQWLHFRRDPFHPQHQLQAISKSQGQKLRVWDISAECALPLLDDNNGTLQRPTRPPFVDVAHTECALGIAGDWAVCGGETFHNQISIVALDPHLVQDPYNHTELALPPAPGAALPPSSSSATALPRRAQRGDLKSVVAVTGRPHLLVLELSDGTVAEYAFGSGALTLVPGLQAPLGAARQMALCPVPPLSQEHLLLVATHHQGRGAIVGLLRPSHSAAAVAPHVPPRPLLREVEMTNVNTTSSATEGEALLRRKDSKTLDRHLPCSKGDASNTWKPEEEDIRNIVRKHSDHGSHSDASLRTNGQATHMLSNASKSDERTFQTNIEKKRPLDKTDPPADAAPEKRKKKKKKRLVDPSSMSTPHASKTFPLTTPFLPKLPVNAFPTQPTPVAAPKVTPDATLPTEQRRRDDDRAPSPPGPPPRREIATPQLRRTLTPRSARPAPPLASDLRQACTQALEQLQRLEEEVPVLSVPRAANVPARVVQMRRHHFAAHCRMRQRVVQATRSTILSLRESPHWTHWDPAQGYLAAALSNYQAITNEMIQLQTVESYTMHAMHPLPEKESAEVAFSFPNIFEQAMACFPKLESS